MTLTHRWESYSQRPSHYYQRATGLNKKFQAN